MTRAEIEMVAMNRLSKDGRAMFHDAVVAGRLEPTAGVSGAVCRLWIDWLQADGATFGVNRLNGDLIRHHVHRTLDTDESFEVYENVSERSGAAAVRDVDNETGNETDLAVILRRFHDGEE